MAQAPKDGAVPAHVEAVGGTDGTATRMLKTDANGELQVDVLTLPTSTPPTGTGATEVQGTAAAGALAVGKPVQVAGLQGTTLRAIPVTNDTAFPSIPVATVNKSNSTPSIGPSSAWGDSVDQDAVPAMVPFFLGTGTGLRRLRGVELTKTALSAALAKDTDLAIWTPTTGNKFRLFNITITAAVLTIGDVIELRDGATVIRQWIATNTAIQIVEATPANGQLSAAANNVLNIRHVTTVQNAKIAVNVSGMEE